MSAVLADPAMTPVTVDEGCFHCGLPVPPGSAWSVEIGGKPRAMCCPGCEAVAQTIVDNGLTNYYLSRTEHARTADMAALVPPELKLYDADEAAARFASRTEDGESCEAGFSVDGIRCAACVWLIERRLAKLPGVQQADLNVATERLQVRWNPGACTPSAILGALRQLGYDAYPFDPVRHGEQLQRQGKKLFRQLFIAGLSMMQVMMYAVPAYLATDGTMEADMAALMQWASLLLTVPAVFYSAMPFFKGAWANLKARTLGMDVPVALGIAAAFGGSLVATLQGKGEVYFDSVTMFIFLLLCSRYLELAARRKAASALECLQRALPASASRMAGYPASRDAEAIPASQLAEGDFMLVKPGEAIAADCVIVEGNTSVDLSLLTGESVPVRKCAGDALPGGAVNATQPVVAKVTKVARESTLSALVRLVERAGQGKSQLALWADKVAGWFVACLLVFAVSVFIAWHFVDPARAWPIAIAVLVVSCPCALSLATPTALAAATDRLVQGGVLVVQPHVLETLHRATHVVFDKTGTLTSGKPVLQHVEAADEAGAEKCLRIAAALEQSSAHPLAVAIVEGAHRWAKGEMLIAGEVTYSAGEGIEGVVGGTRYRLGSAPFVAALAGLVDAGKPVEGGTSVYLGSNAGMLARFDLADAIREDAAAVVKHFQSLGKKVILLSGDRQDVTTHIARELGIEEAHGECLPQHKLDFVQALQQQGAVVAMVGDGINDAAVLRAADVSFAMGGGATLAQAHADTVLLSGRLSSVAEAAQLATRTMSVIRQNLAWATLYNAIAIPAAALGYLNPWVSGIGMSASSAVVVINALRLRRASLRRGSQVQQPAALLPQAA
jgi:Cu2+-exporting ATPase